MRSARKFMATLLGCLVLATPAAAETVHVFAAASLREAVSEIAQIYGADTGDEVVTVFAGSSAIARQVAQGAPADVVLLADEAWGDWLLSEGIVAEALVPFAGNRLVLVARADADIPQLTHPDQILDVLDGGRLAMAQVDAVPAGRYGRAALISAEVWPYLVPRVVQSSNVRAALFLLERGEVPLAVGYASDLVALPDLKAVHQFDPATHPAIRYVGAALTARGDGFMALLLGAPGQDILSAWGFAPVPE